jgi:hypothetical protein
MLHFRKKTAYFSYSYGINSKPDSIQNVWNFTLEFLDKNAKPYRVSAPSIWNYSFTATGIFEGGPTKMAPANAVGFAAVNSRNFLLPGDSIKGLTFLSKGLPGIVRSWTQGYVPLPPSVPDVNPALTAKCPDQGYSPQMNVILKVPGPDILPQKLTPLQLLTRLINLKEQAYKLGWITNAGVANSLDAKLKEAEKKLKEGQTQVAINLLKSFILDLEAQHLGQTGQGQGANTGNAQISGKHVTDNAYYLLKPNAEFILYKLGVTSFP